VGQLQAGAQTIVRPVQRFQRRGSESGQDILPTRRFVTWRYCQVLLDQVMVAPMAVESTLALCSSAVPYSPYQWWAQNNESCSQNEASLRAGRP
jgi:hypothetical protein